MTASRCARLICAVTMTAAMTAVQIHGVAIAQEAGYSAELIREGVVSELVREGLSLVRLGQDLMVERVGDSWRVALVDRASDAVVSERQVAQLPVDERAAIAHVTVIAGAMIREAQTRRAQPQAPQGGPGAVTPEPLERTAADVSGLGATGSGALRYKREYIWFEDVYFGTRSGQSWRQTLAFRGQYKEALDGDEFYDTVGRPDLAERYRNRRGARLALMGTGMALFVGGVLYPIVNAGLHASRCEQTEGACEGPGSGPLVYGGIAVGAGALSVLIGWAIDPHPVSASEGRELADLHNARLRTELGLPSDWEPKKVSRQTGPSLRLIPTVSASGGGLVLTGSF